MFQRKIAQQLQRYMKVFPVLGLTGPRQSGKTTLAQNLFPHLPYISLENLDIREIATDDPRGFLEKYKEGAIFDEVQNAPQLFSYLQGIVDSDKTNGKYVLTGSQNFLLNQHITQSLAGRIAMATLLPLSMDELNSYDSTKTIFQGGYPRLYQADMRPHEFFPSYIRTYLERDVRTLKKIDDLSLFQRFLKLCAGRVGQLINYSQLAADCGIAPTTARAWLSILEASYIIFLIPPHHSNFSKRLVKMPKLYFYDTGLVCSLLGLEHESQLDTHYLKGALFENLVILEILKNRLNQGLEPNLYFWRDQSGHEVDLIGEWGGTLHAIEIKHSSTFNSSYIKNLTYVMKISAEASHIPLKAYLVYNGTEEGHYKDVQLTTLSKINGIPA